MFIKEFNKTAVEILPAPNMASSYGELRKQLKPGDILVATPQPTQATGVVSKALDRVVGFVMKKVQGSDYTHAAMYTGNGKVTEIRPGAPAMTRPLETALNKLDVYVVRPQVAPRKRQQAIKNIKQMVKDKATYDHRQLAEVTPNKVRRLDTSSVRDRIKAKKVICSNLISNAYSGVKFEKGHDSALLMPSDFLNSPKTRPVTLFKNPTLRAGEKRAALQGQDQKQKQAEQEHVLSLCAALKL